LGLLRTQLAVLRHMQRVLLGLLSELLRTQLAVLRHMQPAVLRRMLLAQLDAW